MVASVYPDARVIEMVPGDVRALIESRSWTRVVLSAGAGLSAASGIPTFRGAGGYYQGRDAYSLASPAGFSADPVLVWNWYAMRIRAVRRAKPNAGHEAIASLTGLVPTAVVTSNVDDLLDRVGVAVARLHGNILEMRGLESGRVEEIIDDEWPVEFLGGDLPCLADGEPARPNVVWFGEYPSREPFELVDRLDGSELFVEVGTSGAVSYGFSEHALGVRCGILRINTELEKMAGITNWVERSEVALPLLATCIARPG